MDERNGQYVSFFTPDTILAQIGNRARDLRIARKLRQADLAARAGVSLSTLKRFEQTGHGGLELLARVSIALNAESGLEYLFAQPPAESLDQILLRARKPARVRKAQ